MKSIDIRFTDQMINSIRAMIGCKMIKYKCDPFVYSTTVFGIAGIITDKGSFAVTNTIEVLDHYGTDEDVAVFRLEERPESEIVSLVDGVTMTDIPVGRIIREIRIINEHQKLYRNEEQTYDVWLTRGIIFIMDDDLEISFEKNVWFSEMITVDRGEKLIDRYSSVNEFADDWDAPYRGICERESVIIN